MTKEEIRAKYARIPTDFSQIEMLKNQLLDAGLLEVAQINPENAGKSIIFDENGALTVGEGGGTVSLDGNSLVIPEQPAPEPVPVATIDGVDYYHKIDTVDLSDSYSYYDIDGNPLSEKPINYPYVDKIDRGSMFAWEVVSSGVYGTGKQQIVIISNGLRNKGLPIHQGAVTIQSEIDNDTLSSDYFTKAYVKLKEDEVNAVFYFNLTTDGQPVVPEYINSIKQGNAVIQLKDDRLPDVAIPQDADKYLHVNAETGALEYVPVNDDGTVSIDGTSLTIHEQSGPEPVITIDGVTYYHKQEFDLESLINALPPHTNEAYDVITKEVVDDNHYVPAVKITNQYAGSAKAAFLQLAFAKASLGEIRPCLLSESSYLNVDFTSRAFTVVNTQDEVTDSTKICLPTCSAYYGFLSEDGKTFISYYNLKGEAPEYVDSIKQGNAVIPLKDSRVPDSAVVDAGKVVKVANDGSYELGEAGGSGTQLYYHTIDGVKKIKLSDGTSENVIFEFISTRPTAFTTMHMQSLKEMIASANKAYFAKLGPGYTLIGVIESKSEYNSTELVSEAYYYDDPDEGTINDTVTPL